MRRKKPENTDLPEFVKFTSEGRATVLRLTQDYNGETCYWKDAGGWGVSPNNKKGKLYSTHPYEHLNGLELFPATKREWFIDNEAHVDNSTLLVDRDDLIELVKKYFLAKQLNGDFLKYASEVSDYSREEIDLSLRKNFHND